MGDISVTVEKIGVEDICWWTNVANTFSRTTSTGGTQTLNAISAKDVPIEDANSYWTANTIEDVLEDMRDGTDPLINNNTFIKSRNAAGTGNVDLIRANSSNLIELGAAPAAQTYGFCPVGSIVAFIPGSFANGSNGTYTFRLGSANTVAAINTLLNTYGWYVCNGAALNLPASPIFNGAGRYLPNLTDDRFIMGDTTVGGTGGSNTSNLAHTHTGPSHTHSVVIPASGWGGEDASAGYLGSSHPGETRRVSGDRTLTSAAGGTGNTGSSLSSSTENRPLYLSCVYIMRVL
mgnify:FL=1